jgi:Class II Aldolase and Adducin N-terminal domain
MISFSGHGRGRAAKLQQSGDLHRARCGPTCDTAGGHPNDAEPARPMTVSQPPGARGHITARIPGEKDPLLINLYGLLYKEITAPGLVTMDVKGEIVWKPDTDLMVGPAWLSV